jgi:transcriptional regulator with XRE-family HTH domain
MAQNEKSLGARVRTLRKARGWSQEQLAKVAGGGIDQTMISRIENRAEYEPGVFTVARIAHALGVQVDAVLQGDQRIGTASGHGSSKWSALEETSISDALRLVLLRVKELEASRGARSAKRRKSR